MKRKTDRLIAKMWQGRKGLLDRHKENEDVKAQVWDLFEVEVQRERLGFDKNGAWWFESQNMAGGNMSQRQQVFKAVGESWERKLIQQGNVPIAKGYVGWLLETQRDKSQEKELSSLANCSSRRITAGEAMARTRRLASLFDDPVVQQNSIVWKDASTNTFMGLKHPNPGGVLWNEDANGKKTSMEVATGKGYEITAQNTPEKRDRAEEDDLMGFTTQEGVSLDAETTRDEEHDAAAGEQPAEKKTGWGQNSDEAGNEPYPEHDAAHRQDNKDTEDGGGKIEGSGAVFVTIKDAIKRAARVDAIADWLSSGENDMVDMVEGVHAPRTEVLTVDERMQEEEKEQGQASRGGQWDEIDGVAHDDNSE